MMASHDEEHFLVGYTKCVGVLKTVNEKLTAQIQWYLSEMIKAETGETNLNHTSSFWKIKTTKKTHNRPHHTVLIVVTFSQVM